MSFHFRDESPAMVNGGGSFPGSTRTALPATLAFMREKELRLALVCYGGISLAVYMHGITKEIWRLARASRAFHAGEAAEGGSEAVYRALLETIVSRVPAS